MRVVKAGYKVFDTKEDLNVTKKIERVARVCYKSEGKISDGSDIAMVGMLMSREHYAMLEHGSLCYIVSSGLYKWLTSLVYEMGSSPTSAYPMSSQYSLSRVRYSFHAQSGRYVLSGNLRAWLELLGYAFAEGMLSMRHSLSGFVEAIYRDTNGVLDFRDKVDDDECNCKVCECSSKFSAERVTDFTELSDEERMIHETLSVLFTVDRGVTHELVRMRDCSFAQESTRYCNYSKGKFGNEITVIKPVFFKEDSVAYGLWEEGCLASEKAYFHLLEEGAIPQEARDVLPQSVKADIVMTANLAEWYHIFELRACDLTGPAHPQMKEVMCPLCRELQEGYYEFAFCDLLVKG